MYLHEKVMIKIKNADSGSRMWMRRAKKIIDAAMALVRDKGYVATTTKEIARVAGVNEVYFVPQI